MNGFTNGEIRQALRPYLRRVRLQAWLRRFGVCAVAGVGAGVVVLLLSFAVPIAYAPAAAAALAALVCLVGGAVLALLPPQPLSAAVEIDRHGFQERVQTLLLLQDSDSSFAALQQEETVRALESANARERIPVRFPWRAYALAGGGIVVACALALAPGPQDGVLQERERIAQVLREQVELVEAGLDLLEKNNTLGDAQKAELNDRLQELAEQLRSGKDYKESIKEISQLQQQLTDAQSRQNRQDIGSLQNSLAQNPGTEDLADRVENQLPEQAARELRQAVEQAMEEGSGPGEDLAQALREAAQELGNGEWKAALEALADALEQGDGAAVQAALQALEQVMGPEGGVGQIGSQLQQAKGQISRLSLGDASAGEVDRLNGSSQDGQGDQQQGGSGPAGPGQPGSGQGGGDSGGTGDSGGSGEGAGSGQTGEAGEGDGGSGAGYGTGDLVESERVYSGERLEADGETARLQGEMDRQGVRQQMETAPGQGTLEGYVPYQDVAGEYAQDAINAAKREELPPAVQSWVEGYFSALQN